MWRGCGSRFCGKICCLLINKHTMQGNSQKLLSGPQGSGGAIAEMLRAPLFVVGLGNPGVKYEQTMHNAGFEFVNVLLAKLSRRKDVEVGQWKFDKYLQAEIAEVRRSGEIFMRLVKPVTFMNLSGVAVGLLRKRYDFDVQQQLVLAYDDLDIELGNYKIQYNKKPKDHNGVNDVVRALGTLEFLHIRIGVDGRTGANKIAGEDYVIMRVGNDDWLTLLETIDTAAEEFTKMVC